MRNTPLLSLLLDMIFQECASQMPSRWSEGLAVSTGRTEGLQGLRKQTHRFASADLNRPGAQLTVPQKGGRVNLMARKQKTKRMRQQPESLEQQLAKTAQGRVRLTMSA